MRRGRFLIEASDALDLVEAVGQGTEAFQARVDEVLERLAPKAGNIGVVLFMLSETARSYMAARPDGVDGELQRLRLLVMEQSENVPA